MTAKYSPRREPGKAKRKGTKRPRKPYSDFPLYGHPLGYWSKRVRGKLLHFGRWGRVVNGKLEHLPYEAGWQAALAAFKARVEDAHTGKIRGTVVQATRTTEGFTLAELCDRFLDAKRQRVNSGEIGQRMYDEYKSITDLLIQQFGKSVLVEALTADDFEKLRGAMAKRWGPVRLGNCVQRVRTVFKYGYESGKIDKPMRFGPGFVKPSIAVLRKNRNEQGKRLLEVAECCKLIKAAPVQLKAMILLGLNCGFGNHDVATVPLSAVNLDTAWIDYARPKSGIERRCPLWSETVAAVKAAIAERPKPKHEDAMELVFVMPTGRAWLCRGIANPVSVAARKLMKDCGVNGRKGLGFYTLRHVFRTVADGSKDIPAVRLIMGHADGSIDAVYREQIDDERLQAVVQHVHDWLYAKG